MAVLIKKFERKMTVLALLIFSLVPFCSVANDWVQVEVIAFEHLAKDRFSKQIYPAYPGSLDTENALGLQGPHKNLRWVRQLKQSDWHLEETAEKLKSSRGERVLYHTGWLQRIYEGERNKPFLLALPISEHQTEGQSLNDEVETQMSLVQGLVSIKPMRQIYHVNIDFMFYADKVPTTGLQGSVIPNKFRLTQHARLKSKELYYFDHPIYGVFLQVSPAAAPVEINQKAEVEN